MELAVVLAALAWASFVGTTLVGALLTRRHDSSLGRGLVLRTDLRDATGRLFSAVFYAIPATIYYYAFPVAFLAPGWFAPLDLPRPSWLLLPGAVLALGGSALHLWGRVALADHWSMGDPKLKEGHALVARGPYRWARHPMYGATILHFLGLALLWPNALLSLSLLVVPGLYRLSTLEDELLAEHFGTAHAEFLMRRGRFFPWPRTAAARKQ